VWVDEGWLVLVWTLVTISVSIEVWVILCDVAAVDKPNPALIVVVDASVWLMITVSVKYSTA